MSLDYGQLAEIVFDELQTTGYRSNSCILAARMTGIVLRELGVGGVEAMACEVEAFSPAYVEMRALDGGLTDAEVDRWKAAGAWKVQASFGPPPPGMQDKRARGYNGHVVTLVDRRVMIDPTLPQVNRPDKNLRVDPPFAFEIDYDEARVRSVHISANGTYVFHRLIPGRKDFTKAPDWRLVPRDDATIGRILNRLTGVPR